MNLTVLIFFSRDNAPSAERAHCLYEALANCKGPSLRAKLIDKLSSDVEDLRLIVRHKIITTPAVLVLRGPETVARLLQVPEPDHLLGVLQTLT